MAKDTPSNRFAFTEANIKAIQPPAKGRAWYYDTKQPGLALMVTATGAKAYYFYKWQDGKPERVTIGKQADMSVIAARDDARAKIGKQNLAEERKAKRQEPALENLWAHWLIYAEAHKKPLSVKGDRLNFGKHLKAWEGRRLSTIKKADVQALHAEIGRTHGTYAANRAVALLKAMYNKAEDIGYRGSNPCAKITMFKEVSRDRFLQAAELEAFFAALESENEAFRHFFLMCLFTGARKSNVMTMRWEDIDLINSIWRIPETKGGTPVVIPLVGPAMEILRGRVDTSGNGEWVFPGHRRGDHMREPREAWARVLAAAGIKNLHIHDLRRSLGSWLAGLNVSLPIIGRLLGHTTPQATMIYSRLALDPLREAAEKATSAIVASGKLRLTGDGPPAK